MRARARVCVYVCVFAPTRAVLLLVVALMVIFRDVGVRER